MSFFGTRAARRLGVPAHQLHSLLRSDQLGPPLKSESGDYLWTCQDVERARQALAQRHRPRREPAQGGCVAAAGIEGGKSAIRQCQAALEYMKDAVFDPRAVYTVPAATAALGLAPECLVRRFVLRRL
jgi:hypothetical protein